MRRFCYSTPMVLVALAIPVACSTETASPPPTTAPAMTPPQAQVTIAPSHEEGQQQLQAATPGAQRIIAKTTAALGLEPIEAACLAQRLDADPGLRDSLGDEPATSSRYNDLAAVSQECIRTTTGAINFANSIAAQAGGALSTETLTCLRDRWAGLTSAETGALTQAALNPGTIDQNAKATIDRLLDGCGVDRSMLPPRPGN